MSRIFEKESVQRQKRLAQFAALLHETDVQTETSLSCTKDGYTQKRRNQNENPHKHVARDIL
jgi:hypothetical protein